MKKYFFIFAAIVFFTVGLLAQEQRAPASNFSKTEREDFNSKKFNWEDASTIKGGTIVKGGYLLLKGKRPTFSPNPVNVVSTSILPFDPKNNFKITVNLNIIELTGYSVFQIILNSGNVVFGIAEGDWAAVVNGATTQMIQGLKKTSKKDNVSLSIQKEGKKLYFFYNDSLLGSLESQEIKSSDVTLSIGSIVKSAEVRVYEVIVEY